jgi:tetratricopeptide (TPR) repeat protein
MSADSVADAIKLFDRALELRPNWRQALNSRGWAYHRLKKDWQAIQDFDLAIRLNPA